MDFQEHSDNEGYEFRSKDITEEDRLEGKHGGRAKQLFPVKEHPGNRGTKKKRRGRVKDNQAQMMDKDVFVVENDSDFCDSDERENLAFQEQVPVNNNLKRGRGKKKQVESRKSQSFRMDIDLDSDESDEMADFQFQQQLDRAAMTQHQAFYQNQQKSPRNGRMPDQGNDTVESRYNEL